MNRLPSTAALLSGLYLGVFAAMLQLSIVRADAQTLEAPPSIEISSPTDVGDVHIRDGAEITVIKGGSLTGSPNPIWEIGDVHDETGTLNIEGGTVTLVSKAELRLGTADDTKGIVLVSNPGKLEVNGLIDIGANPSSRPGVGEMTVENGGEVAAEQIISRSGAATLILNGGTITALPTTYTAISLAAYRPSGSARAAESLTQTATISLFQARSVTHRQAFR
jgi:hypothetical protein